MTQTVRTMPRNEKTRRKMHRRYCVTANDPERIAKMKLTLQLAQSVQLARTVRSEAKATAAESRAVAVAEKAPSALKKLEAGVDVSKLC